MDLQTLPIPQVIAFGHCVLRWVEQLDRLLLQDSNSLMFQALFVLLQKSQPWGQQKPFVALINLNQASTHAASACGSIGFIELNPWPQEHLSDVPVSCRPEVLTEFPGWSPGFVVVLFPVLSPAWDTHLVVLPLALSPPILTRWLDSLDGPHSVQVALSALQYAALFPETVLLRWKYGTNQSTGIDNLELSKFREERERTAAVVMCYWMYRKLIYSS